MDRQPSTRDEQFWHDFLTQGGDSLTSIGRRVFKRLPADPRCRMCAAPFTGPGARMMRLIGKRPSDANPTWCNSCIAFISKHHGGAEVEGTMLFVDIRGSTALGESMSPAAFHGLLDRFYATATRVIFDNDGYIDKFVGDEVVALFFPLLSGERHTARAVDAALGILRATGHADPDGPWVPLGAGVHTGRAWFGAVGEGRHVELTALGDTVNTAARIASHAGTGEVVVSTDAAAAAGLDPDLPRTPLKLKGKQAPTEVVTLRVAAEPT